VENAITVWVDDDQWEKEQAIEAEERRGLEQLIGGLAVADDGVDTITPGR